MAWGLVDLDVAWGQEAPKRTCDQPGAKTLVANGQARIYRLPRLGANFGDRVVGCNLVTGQERPLAGHIFELRAYPPPAMALAGHRLVIAIYVRGEAGGLLPAQVDVDLVDVNTWERAKSADSGPDGDVFTVGSAAVTPIGGYAWISCPGGETTPGTLRGCVRPGRHDYVFKVDSTGNARRPKRLDSGSAIDPSSLRRRGSKISWLNNGKRRTAPLK